MLFKKGMKLAQNVKQQIHKIECQIQMFQISNYRINRREEALRSGVHHPPPLDHL